MTERVTSGRYPGYDVLTKRDSLSWNDKTREVIDARLSVPSGPAFLSFGEWRTLEALCDRVMPQPAGKSRVPLAVYVDRQLLAGKTKGYRFAHMPQPADAWKQGLAALEEVAMREQGRAFAHLTQSDQDAMLSRMAEGTLEAASLRGMPSNTFWSSHVIHDVVGAYYAHPEAWNEMGWAGPASPRGYVRLGLDRRDAWEPEESEQADDEKVIKKNSHVR